MKILSFKALRWLPILSILVFWACRVSDTEGDQYLVWHLNASLADYDTVSIRLVDAQDSAVVYEQIWNAKLPDPEHFPKHKLEAARDKDFTIQIRAYNDKHELVWAKNIEVAGGKPKDPVLLTADLRLFQIKAPPLDLSPGFNPNVFDYAAHVGDSIDAFSLSAEPMDSSNGLLVDGKAVAWGKAVPEALVSGDNTFELKVKGKDDEVRVYHLTVTRGTGGTPEEGDKPVLNLGPNQAVRKGDEVTFPVSVTVKKGAIASFKYDLEGDGTWDNTDTTAVPASLQHKYAENKVYTARFQARSTLGPVDSITCTINVTDARYLLAITSPSRDTLVAESPFRLKYTVNGTALSRDVVLTDGENTVKVDTGDGADLVSASVKITLDSVPPKAPNLSAATPTPNLRPQWTWTGGGGGNGRFRVRLDSSDLSGTAETPATQFVPGADLKRGDHTLYVAERDEAGNWSPAASFKVTIAAEDDTGPNAPKVSGASPTNSAPKWTWTTGGGGGDGNFRYKVNDSTLATGATATTDTALTYAGSLSNGATYTLYVQEKDAAGNWSAAGSRAIVYDASKPSVTIVAPLSSGTYLTKEAAVGLSGKASGPQAISKVTYKVNGGAALDASLSGDAWIISALTLTEGAALVVTVTATDAANNSAEASVSLLKDATAPTAPVFTSEPTTPTASSRGSWAWKAGSDGTGGSGLSGKYRYSQDGGKTWVETSASLVNDLALAEGNNALDLQEQDLAGNWSLSATSVVKSDRSGPKLALTSPAKPVSLKTVHVTLSGTAADDGTSVQSVTITGQKSGSGAAVLAGNAWTSAALTLDTGSVSLIVTATDLLGNASKDTVAVSVKVPVAAVAITSPAANFLTNKDTITVKYTIDGGAETAKAFNLAAEGNNVLTIASPANEAGVTGSASVTVVRDKTAPVVTITSPAPGSITNQTSVTISYTEKDGAAAAVAKTQIVNLAKDSGAVNTFTINSTADAAGNVGSAAISLYKRSYVTFFKPAGAGLANGTSWANAYGSAQLQPVMNAAAAHAEIWLTAGAYASLDTAAGFRLHSKISLYGGFPAAGTAKAIGDRTFAAADTTVLSSAKGASVMLVPGVQHAGMDSVILDGFKFIVGAAQIGFEPDWTFSTVVRNVNFHASGPASQAALHATQTDLSLDNCKFTGFTTGTERLIYAGGRSGTDNFTLSNCEFSGNTWDGGANAGEIVLFYPDDVLKVSNTKFLDALPSGTAYIDLSSGDITVSGSTFLSTSMLLTSVTAPDTGTRTDGGGNSFLNQH